MNQSILFVLLAVLLFTNCFVQSAPRSFEQDEESNEAADKRGISSFTEFLQDVFMDLGIRKVEDKREILRQILRAVEPASQFDETRSVSKSVERRRPIAHNKRRIV
ncbi:unnamed protein product [Adineta ricciae]|uniref:Uncharacterized protein n=1 Tax=Adineta ricciae TaxID=249248 RepID=A0A814DIM8_ADIRI|nr:unnamed protein product [Adineta ricciae]CAF1089407.1 unnamed protein product [Adineta ricciae]